MSTQYNVAVEAKLTSIHIQLYVRIYILARKIQSLLKVKNSDRMNELVLLTLVQDKKSSVSALAHLLAIKPSAASNKIKKLQQSGLLILTKGIDGREKVVTATKKGKRYIEKMITTVHQRCHKACSAPLHTTAAKTALRILNTISI